MTRRRCAIYTRKSTEEGLEQDFNSLQAQREACEAYIKSQAHEGWKLRPVHYDDGGFSGGSMERPALQQLLGDIDAGLIDTVVVYKVDRLTRSLSDFARIVETFDAKGVSFVSVTQQFNTTSSMGRLTLNVLLSFAQFEREVTAERIRDKIAASKQKGIWMGGTVPLGYEAKNRDLIIIQSEAETVRTLFRLYLELGTVRKLKAEADRLGLTTKRRTDPAGQVTGDKAFARGHLYQLLRNPLYAGQIVHKGARHPGRHPAIIDPETFEAVQQQLAGNTNARQTKKNVKEPSLLAGLVFDETGDRLCPTHTNKKGRRYRYYISKRLMHRSENAAVGGWRVPGKELEATALEAIQRLLNDKTLLITALKLGDVHPDQLQSVLAKATDANARLRGHSTSSRQMLASNLLRRIQLRANSMQIEIKRSALAELLIWKTDRDAARADGNFEYSVPIQLKRRGAEAKMVILGNAARALSLDENLVAAVGDAHRWANDLAQGRATSLRDLARRNRRDLSEVSRILALAFLAPKIVSEILDGQQPRDLTSHRLKRAALPSGWSDQCQSLGFSEPGDVPIELRGTTQERPVT